MLSEAIKVNRAFCELWYWRDAIKRKDNENVQKLHSTNEYKTQLRIFLYADT